MSALVRHVHYVECDRCEAKIGEESTKENALEFAAGHGWFVGAGRTLRNKADKAPGTVVFCYCPDCLPEIKMLDIVTNTVPKKVPVRSNDVVTDHLAILKPSTGMDFVDRNGAKPAAGTPARAPAPEPEPVPTPAAPPSKSRTR